MRALLIPALLVGALALPASAGADDVIGVSNGPTGASAYGGVTAFSERAADGRYRLMLRSVDGTIKAAPIAPSSAPFDASVGPDVKGRVVVLYTRCAQLASAPTNVSNGCDVYRFQTSSARESKLAFSSPSADEAWPAQWHDTFVFTRRAVTGFGAQRQRCDISIRRRLAGAPHTLDRGRCGRVDGVAVRGSVIAQSVTSPNVSQLRLLSTRGGAVRVAASQKFGEESNLFGGPALDARYLYATRFGTHPAATFVRIRRATLHRQEVRARLDLTGAVAIDGPTLSYVSGSRGGGCDPIAPCRVVRSPASPFGGARRVLPASLTLLAPGGSASFRAPVPADQPLALSGAMTRTVVQAGNVVGGEPQAGRALTLQLAAGPQGTAYAPTTVTATTAADGSFALTAPAPIPPLFGYAVRSADAIPVQSPQLYGNANAVITAAAPVTTVLKGLPVAISGTISPAQPGRNDVKLQRLTSRKCDTAQNGSQICNDTWETVADATESPDGRAYAVTAQITQSGTYTVVLPFISGSTTAYSGRSPELTLTVSG